jgi:hypothetical protein
LSIPFPLDEKKKYTYLMKEVTTDSAEKIISQQAALNRRRGTNFIDNLSTMINNHSGPDYTQKIYGRTCYRNSKKSSK